jgi:hypothetical protein
MAGRRCRQGGQNAGHREVSPTTPYWLRLPPESGLYQVDDPTNIGKPEGVPSLQVEWTFEVGPKARRRALTVSRPVTFKWTDPVAGERYRPLEVTPAVSVRPESSVLLFADDRPKSPRRPAPCARSYPPAGPPSRHRFLFRFAPRGTRPRLSSRYDRRPPSKNPPLSPPAPCA